MKKNLFLWVLIGLIVFSFQAKAQKIVKVNLPNPCNSIGILESPNDLNGRIKIYPNPSKGNFTIQYDCSLNCTNSTVSIYTIQGKVLYSKEHSFTNGVLELSGLSLVQGFYFIKVQDDKQVVIKQIIVE